MTGTERSDWLDPRNDAHRDRGDAPGLYVRATLSQWRRSHGELTASGHTNAGPTGSSSRENAAGGQSRGLIEAAVHALLAALRPCAGTGALLDRYEADPAADFALIASLLPLDPDGAAEDLYALSRVREAAFWLRWLELTRGPGSGRA